MRPFLLIVLLSLLTSGNAQQFKYDNVTYTTVFLEDLCKTLKENPGFSLLDVRSNGEYYDTSFSPGSNIGKLKNATHIPVAELSTRLNELNDLKDKPLFIYCSHSQRSRRASKMLADSGFTKIYNINGGLTRVLLYWQTLPDCFKNIYTNNLSYNILSPGDIMDKAKKTNPFYIIDLRSDSVFRGISTFEKRNAKGHLEGSHNILSSQFESNLSTIPMDKPILLVDESGNDSPQAAELLRNLGYKNLNILFNGLDAWTDQEVNEVNNSAIKRITNKTYHELSGEKFTKLASGNDVIIIDLRNKDQFENQSKNYRENIGNIKEAVNIPFSEIKNSNLLPSVKTTPIVLYSFTNQSDVYESAKLLTNLGYKNVNILRGGIWNLRWAAFNLKNKAALKEWVVNLPEENQ